MLTQEHFEIYARHLRESEHLYIRPRVIHAGNAMVPAYNLTTVELIVPEESKRETHPYFNDALAVAFPGVASIGVTFFSFYGLYCAVRALW